MIYKDYNTIGSFSNFISNVFAWIPYKDLSYHVTECCDATYSYKLDQYFK
jgi:hypothetical protein